MADGSRQVAFPFHALQPRSRLRQGEIVVDLFAGGGGASHALESALARAVDIAINHNPWAIGMHAANHPYTKHLIEDVWAADPWSETLGRLVGWLHASPDCTHFSQAKGGQPRDRATRSLSWVVPKWAGQLRKRGTPPRIISLENVVQILKWGPLVAKRDKATGRIFTMDLVQDRRTGKMVHRVADPGEQVPVTNQYLVPDKRHEGRTWRRFICVMRALGYTAEWRKLKACDYGAGTSRERLFAVFRCDGEPIRWPEPTHGPGRTQPYVTAADCIDWSIPCPSIFTRKKPLADATHRRIARGIRRYVLEAAEPFIVGVGGRMGQSAERGVSDPLQTLTAKADSCICSPSLVPLTHQGSDRINDPAQPLPTITGANRGEIAVMAPTLIQCANASASGIASADDPLGVVTAWPKGGSHAVTVPLLVQAGYGEREGQAPRALDLSQPLGVVVAGGVKHAVASASLVKFRGASDGGPVTDPMPTITSGAGAARPAGAAHAMGVITAHLTAMAQNVPSIDPEQPLPTILAGATRFGVVAAHLEQANGGFYEGPGRGADEPMSTITGSGSQQRLVTASLATLRNNMDGQPADAPLSTICAAAEHHAVVEYTLSPEHEEGALRVAAFLMRYHGLGGQDSSLEDPITTITTRDRLALVTVTIRGTPYVIVDIGLRMLQRQELFLAQGFPKGYIIDRTADGRVLSVSRSVSMVGNSVSPPPMEAVAIVNLDPATEPVKVAA